MPETPADGRRAGCAVYGQTAGTGIRNVLQLLGGGLTRFVEPNAEGQVQLVALFRAVDWAPGQSALDLRATRIEVLDGIHTEAREFRVSRRSFWDDDPERGPRIVLDGQVDDGWIETQPATAFVPLPLLSATTVLLELRHARLGARMAADGPGFRLDRGHLAGYLTDEGLLDLIGQVKVLCASDAPPGVCALLGQQIEQPIEEVFALIRGIVGENDVRVTDLGASDCAPKSDPPCNAVAVCLALSARGVEIAGVEGE